MNSSASPAVMYVHEQAGNTQSLRQSYSRPNMTSLPIILVKCILWADTCNILGCLLKYPDVGDIAKQELCIKAHI